MQNIADLRKEYSRATLDISNVLTDPVKQFEKWFDEAVQAGVTEPNAMHFATVNEQGKPSSRIVLLKGIEDGRFIFYTNYQSKKGKELETNPACALTFFWPDIERQVRIEGIATRVDQATSDQYFQSRPRGSQIGAWASPQSTIIKDRDILEDRASQIEKKFENNKVLPRPHQWGGYQIEPLLIEFWQGRASRLHDRIQFVKTDGVWKAYRLAP
ncbi:pyridoxamine 5'-phosphate oxidase [Fulvivirgaceae bacterium PWU4]|uniref:Pyridoxine/pyridoxamine 5'-phosphate oxidase n=1 Tax=Chryseosolibacter histidini TaxID=2782349 RepID=A0AAP2DI49_9BACT|nr:pyridoxamine 5'-phosphate oxidase [Chryseosolibacter histidini]MBT1696796.1 pyridoxamine 5'-phosphate oxidase [Chryseosolibacter histidini]